MFKSVNCSGEVKSIPVVPSATPALISIPASQSVKVGVAEGHPPEEEELLELAPPVVELLVVPPPVVPVELAPLTAPLAELPWWVPLVPAPTAP